MVEQSFFMKNVEIDDLLAINCPYAKKFKKICISKVVMRSYDHIVVELIKNSPCGNDQKILCVIHDDERIGDIIITIGKNYYFKNKIKRSFQLYDAHISERGCAYNRHAAFLTEDIPPFISYNGEEKYYNCIDDHPNANDFDILYQNVKLLSHLKWNELKKRIAEKFCI